VLQRDLGTGGTLCRLSVRMSVTSRYHLKTKAARRMVFITW